ncbi:MAG: autotransporter outer membrane beta-barrel domain-containing protein, partial [Gammaproteobacteria bacterium]|nr:autotransporter outer membrane beta-barrel domain-containing protein [Gammaproteobacteria bacterium]
KNICNNIVGLNDKADNDAVAALRHEEVATQGNASLESSRKHTASISQRINTLRQSKVGGGSGDDNDLLEASRWGFFTNIGHNKGDRVKTIGVTGVGALGDASQATVQGEQAFDYDGNDLSVGLDYRFPDDKFIVGGSLGYNKLDSRFTTQAGKTKLKGQHISAYASYLPSEYMYIDGIVSLGSNAINASRPVPVFDNITGAVLATDGRAFADTDSQQISMSIGMGYEYNRSAWNITPYTRLDYTKTEIDDYTETVLDNDPTGRDSRGMILSIKEQSATSLIGTLGIRTSYPISSSGGVFIPQASLELNHQFKKDDRFIDATLPVASSLDSDNPNTQTSQLDRNYLKLGVGVSAIFPNGHSGFVQLESLQGSDDLSDTAIKAGYRLEF